MIRSHWRLMLLAALTVLRLCVAAWMPLSADEAYYRVWSHALAAGYPDHPSMVALWIGLGTAIAGDTALGVRLLGPIAALVGSLLLVQTGRDLARARDPAAPDGGRPGDPGWQAAWLLNGTLICNAGAVIMTPDTPLLLFWAAGLAAVARAICTGNAQWWLAGGAAAGLAMDSKYTAILLVPALLAWLIAVPSARHWLRRWQLYAGGAIAAALFSPVFAWNAAHHWASFVRQGGRAGAFHPTEAGRYLAELVAGQIGLATPLLFAVFCVGVVRCARHRAWRESGAGLLLAVTVIPALVFLQHALGARVQANWLGILYPGAALAAALTGVPFQRPAIALGAALSGALYLQATAAPLALPRRVDFTLIRLAGWGDLAHAADQARSAEGAGFIASDEYGLASELAFHLRGTPMAAVEPRWSMFNLRPAKLDGQTGILVRSDREAKPPDPRIWPNAIAVGTSRRARGGVVAETYTFYRVRAPHAAAVLLPSPAAPAD